MVNAPLLSEAQQAKLDGFFTTLVARAESAPPKLGDFKDPAAYDAASQTYYSNPFLDKIQQYRAEREQNMATDSVRANQLYEYRIGELKKAFSAGVQTGAPDPDAERKQMGIIEEVMSGNFMGAIKKFVLSIPVVGDMMAAGMKMLRGFMNGEKMGFGEALDRIKMERALAGGALNMGLDERSLNREGILAMTDPNFKPMERPKEGYNPITPQVAAQAANENNTPARPDDFQGANGVVPAGGAPAVPVNPAEGGRKPAEGGMGK
jgi:hypothetical protein